MKKLLLVLLVIISQNVSAQTDLNLSFETVDSLSTSAYFIKNWFNGGVCDNYCIVNNAYDGEKAVRINAWYVNKPGYLILGKEEEGMPFTKKPLFLNGYYKYEYGNNCGRKDSAEVYAFLKRYNVALRKTDTVAKAAIKLLPKATYTSFKIPFFYVRNDVEPDSIMIELYSRPNDRNSPICSTPDNLFFTIDNLSFDFATATNDANSFNSVITLHPNPTFNFVHIDWGKNGITDIILKDTLERILLKKAVFTEGIDIDLSGLPSGLYFVELNRKGHHLATRKVIRY